MKKISFFCSVLILLYACGTTATVSSDTEKEHKAEHTDLRDLHKGQKQTIELTILLNMERYIMIKLQND